MRWLNVHRMVHNRTVMNKIMKTLTVGELIEKLEIKTPSTELPVRMLSGGNVQKVLLGREIHSEPDLLITAYPVRGWIH